mmetsp:Transcript_67615/g.156967  ORF Transcript_67615/g.156967 Transcript_67615/m.156967 type:complete len:333 (+) Transcript_67615:345-1343(+)
MAGRVVPLPVPRLCGSAQLQGAICTGGDCADVQWTPGDAALLLWERPARGPRLRWYSPRGELLGEVNECKLMRSAFVSPTSQFVAVGCFDGSLHLVNSMTMKPMAQLAHDVKVACFEADEADVTVWREEVVKRDTPEATLGVLDPGCSVRYFQLPNPATTRIPEERPGAEPTIDIDGLPRKGVGTVVWSPDERYIASKHDGMPTAVWVWDLARLALVAVLLHRTPVRSFAWDPLGGLGSGTPRLAVATVDPLLFTWLPGSASTLPCPFSAARLLWRIDGKALLLQERERACIFWVEPPTLQAAEVAATDRPAAGSLARLSVKAQSRDLGRTS